MSRIWWEPKVENLENKEEVSSLFDAYEKKWTVFCLIFGSSCFVCGILLGSKLFG
jgi:hypothetical protein